MKIMMMRLREEARTIAYSWLSRGVFKSDGYDAPERVFYLVTALGKTRKVSLCIRADADEGRKQCLGEKILLVPVSRCTVCV